MIVSMLNIILTVIFLIVTCLTTIYTPLTDIFFLLELRKVRSKQIHVDFTTLLNQ